MNGVVPPLHPQHVRMSSMRLATWNLERGGRTRAARAAQQRVLASNAMGADVLVLTEPPASVMAGPGTVISPPGRHGSWVVIQGRHVQPVELPIPYDRMAVAARVGTTNGAQIIVYGTVLPWTAVTRHAPDLVRSGEDSLAAFKRVLEEQANDILALKQLGDPVVWVGDFNQSVQGANFGGSTQRRDLLTCTLKFLNMVAWNANAAHAKPGMYAIDLICGPQQQTVTASDRIDPSMDGVTMSDHAGYWVDIL